MEQILKFLSPIAILGLIWGIIQFYQKRTHSKSDIRRQETLSTYKEFHSIINSIKNEYWKLFTIISQTSLVLEKKINQSKDYTFLEDQKLKLSEFNLKSNIEIKELDRISKIIKNKEFDTKKYTTMLQKQKEVVKKINKKGNDLLNELNNNMNFLKNRHIELIDYLDNNGKDLSDNVKNIYKVLQVLVLDLNKIPLIGINVKQQPNLLILQLIKLIQEQINQIEVEEYINHKIFLEIIKAENIKEILDMIFKIENHIYQTLKN